MSDPLKDELVRICQEYRAELSAALSTARADSVAAGTEADRGKAAQRCKDCCERIDVIDKVLKIVEEAEGLRAAHPPGAAHQE